MKQILLAFLVVIAVVAVAPRGGTANPMPSTDVVQMSYDDDDDEEEWKCTCSVTCDDTKFSVTEKVCADDEDLKEAMQEAVDACYKDADPKCDDEPACKCSCKATNREC